MTLQLSEVNNEQVEAGISGTSDQADDSVETANSSNDGNGGGSDDTDDDYLMSDNDIEEETVEGVRIFNGLILEGSNYLTESLSNALDSLELDKSLVLQAQLSGILNNENQKLIDKREELLQKLANVQKLYKEKFQAKTNGMNFVLKMSHDLKDIEARIHTLKYGSNPSVLKVFASKSVGIQRRFPVEYNQAKDKVLERQVE